MDDFNGKQSFPLKSSIVSFEFEHDILRGNFPTLHFLQERVEEAFRLDHTLEIVRVAISLRVIHNFEYSAENSGPLMSCLGPVVAMAL